MEYLECLMFRFQFEGCHGKLLAKLFLLRGIKFNRKSHGATILALHHLGHSIVRSYTH